MGKHIIKPKTTGFTIVELLIVVVVIAILAAITIVAYNGITKRANDSVAQNKLSTIQKKVAQYYIENGDTYPTIIEDAGISNDSNEYQYTANNSTSPKGYCASVKVNSSQYYFANQFVPLDASSGVVNTPASVTGLCAGHFTQGTTITNYVPNSGVGSSLSGYGGPNSSTIYRDTTKGAEGTASSVLVTMPQAPYATVGMMFYNVSDVSGVFIPGVTYTVSAWVWVPSSTVNVRLSIQGAGRAKFGNLPTRLATVKDQWVRIYDTFVADTSGAIIFYILNEANTPVANTQFWADSFMINQSNVPATYANGNAAGWVWNGMENNSTSTGPAL